MVAGREFAMIPALYCPNRFAVGAADSNLGEQWTFRPPFRHDSRLFFWKSNWTRAQAAPEPAF
jgi:hypothetical protein